MRLKSDLELISAIPFVAGLNESLNIIKSPSIVVDKTIVSLVKLTSHIIDYGEYKLGMIPEKDFSDIYPMGFSSFDNLEGILNLFRYRQGFDKIEAGPAWDITNINILTNRRLMTHDPIDNFI